MSIATAGQTGCSNTSQTTATAPATAGQIRPAAPPQLFRQRFERLQATPTTRMIMAVATARGWIVASFVASPRTTIGWPPSETA